MVCDGSAERWFAAMLLVTAAAAAEYAYALLIRPSFILCIANVPCILKTFRLQRCEQAETQYCCTIANRTHASVWTAVVLLSSRLWTKQGMQWVGLLQAGTGMSKS